MITVIGNIQVRINVVPEIPQNMEEGQKYKDTIRTCSSGCGFNVAKYLAQEGLDVSLISVAGDDMIGRAAIEELKMAGVDISNMRVIDGATPLKVNIFNVLGDVEISKGDDDSSAAIDVNLLKECSAQLENSDAVFFEGSLPQQTMEYIVKEYGRGTKHNKRLFFDPATIEGGRRAAGILDGLYAITPGRMEAEAMSGLNILSQDQIMAAGKAFEDRGISKMFITMRGGGIYYKEGMDEGILRPERILSFADTSGAGDVVAARFMADAMKGMGIEDIARASMTAAAEHLAAVEDIKPI